MQMYLYIAKKEAQQRLVHVICKKYKAEMNVNPDIFLQAASKGLVVEKAAYIVRFLRVIEGKIITTKSPIYQPGFILRLDVGDRKPKSDDTIRLYQVYLQKIQIIYTDGSKRRI